MTLEELQTGNWLAGTQRHVTCGLGKEDITTVAEGLFYYFNLGLRSWSQLSGPCLNLIRPSLLDRSLVNLPGVVLVPWLNFGPDNCAIYQQREFKRLGRDPSEAVSEGFPQFCVQTNTTPPSPSSTQVERRLKES